MYADFIMDARGDLCCLEWALYSAKEGSFDFGGRSDLGKVCLVKLLPRSISLSFRRAGRCLDAIAVKRCLAQKYQRTFTSRSPDLCRHGKLAVASRHYQDTMANRHDRMISLCIGSHSLRYTKARVFLSHLSLTKAILN